MLALFLLRSSSHVLCFHAQQDHSLPALEMLSGCYGALTIKAEETAHEKHSLHNHKLCCWLSYACEDDQIVNVKED
jgi:hypothetical protein